MSENKLVVFAVGEMRVGLPVHCVDKVVFACEVSPLPNAPPVVLGVVDFHGTLGPIFDMNSRFGFPSRGIQTDNYFVICNTPKRKVALLVNQILDVINYNPAALVQASDVLPNLEYIEGIIRHSDGMIVVQDLSRFLSIEEENALQAAMTKHKPK